MGVAPLNSRWGASKRSRSDQGVKAGSYGNTRAPGGAGGGELALRPGPTRLSPEEVFAPGCCTHIDTPNCEKAMERDARGAQRRGRTHPSGQLGHTATLPSGEFTLRVAGVTNLAILGPERNAIDFALPYGFRRGAVVADIVRIHSSWWTTSRKPPKLGGMGSRPGRTLRDLANRGSSTMSVFGGSGASDQRVARG